MTNIFIDGSAGTTGLRIHERLAQREDITLLQLPDALRKDPAARSEMFRKADIVFLCLPDAAAVEAVGLLESSDAIVIDTSTAHRTADGWTYGFPEIGTQRAAIRQAHRIANPGCHASGFIALIAPLTAAGILDTDAALSCYSLTGYSGGGKKMIAAYEAAPQEPLLTAPRLYGLSQTHKHLPEMAQLCGLQVPPVFCPVVAPYYAGMEVTVPLHTAALHGDIEAVKEAYRHYYTAGLVHFKESADENGFLSAAAFAGRDDMEITVCGNAERVLLVARFDNLGKGASGAAIQNMNICLGLNETTGLNIQGGNL